MIIAKCFVCLAVLLLVGIGIFFLVGEFKFLFQDYSTQIIVDTSKEIFQVDERFLSVALDTSFMRCPFHKLSEREWQKLIEFSSLISPGYLRLGGTDADNVLFSLNDTLDQNISHQCSNYTTKTPLIITGQDWIKINDFAKKAKLNFIFDLNVLRRNGLDWDSSNAEVLIKFSEENNFALDFQLGNEPNSFPHVFNVTISGSQLAKDFNKLKKILNASNAYKNSKLIGPDVTRPKKFQLPALKFLENFLESTNVIDVVSWHQYYLNGRTATLEDFLKPEIFDELSSEIKLVAEVVRKFSSDVPIWISETSSAYGGGAPHLSDRYVASFLWLDKLGLAARSGISVVIRQSLFHNYYALISPRFTPTSDFWISYFYKNLVGRQVLSIKQKNVKDNAEYLRFYSHCLALNAPVKGSFVIFGMNLRNKTEIVMPSGTNFNHSIYSFTFRPENYNLRSRGIWLNDKPLTFDPKTVHEVLKEWKLVELPLIVPPYSLFFWIFQETKDSVCNKV